MYGCKDNNFLCNFFVPILDELNLSGTQYLAKKYIFGIFFGGLSMIQPAVTQCTLSGFFVRNVLEGSIWLPYWIINTQQKYSQINMAAVYAICNSSRKSVFFTILGFNNANDTDSEIQLCTNILMVCVFWSRYYRRLLIGSNICSVTFVCLFGHQRGVCFRIVQLGFFFFCISLSNFC
eukprot:TRINITY_DN38777_c1_g1_i1.p2 TRINITY_DN38777_c1_g1~~TRINITY_DN38777_c1_g1_i1.p2  ORF type:complete len:178 (+),score=12.45 TRINITY_DN38777_c1_g1_i1:237-770(+)